MPVWHIPHQLQSLPRIQFLDCWQEMREWAFVGSLYKAIESYKAKNKGIERIVIHYYKELNKKEFRQIEQLIDRFDLSIPVIVVRIASTFNAKELVVDLDHAYHLPLNGTYYHLQYCDYLLYINEREEDMQPQLPVTLAYPQYLSRIFPQFEAEILQGIGRTSLWFL